MFKTQLFLNALIVINIVKFVQVIMRWRVQLGNNSTSDVWTFCQNWTSRAPHLFIISITTLDTSQCQHHILSPKPSPVRCLLFVFSFSSFVKAKFGAFVRIFIQFTYNLHNNFHIIHIYWISPEIPGIYRVKIFNSKLLEAENSETFCRPLVDQ